MSRITGFRLCLEGRVEGFILRSTNLQQEGKPPPHISPKVAA